MKGKKFKRIKEVSWQEMDGKGMLISIENSMAHELNSTALEIWKYIETGKDIYEIETHLSNEFNVDKEVLRGDIPTCLRQLELKSLIEIHE